MACMRAHTPTKSLPLFPLSPSPVNVCLPRSLSLALSHIHTQTHPWLTPTLYLCTQNAKLETLTRKLHLLLEIELMMLDPNW